MRTSSSGRPRFVGTRPRTGLGSLERSHDGDHADVGPHRGGNLLFRGRLAASDGRMTRARTRRVEAMAITADELRALERHGTSDVKALVAEVRRLGRVSAPLAEHEEMSRWTHLPKWARQELEYWRVDEAFQRGRADIAETRASALSESLTPCADIVRTAASARAGASEHELRPHSLLRRRSRTRCLGPQPPAVATRPVHSAATLPAHVAPSPRGRPGARWCAGAGEVRSTACVAEEVMNPTSDIGRAAVVAALLLLAVVVGGWIARDLGFGTHTEVGR